MNIKELKLNENALFDLRECLHAGIELRQKASKILGNTKADYICLDVDQKLVNRFNELLDRVDVKIAELEW